MNHDSITKPKITTTFWPTSIHYRIPCPIGYMSIKRPKIGFWNLRHGSNHSVVKSYG